MDTHTCARRARPTRTSLSVVGVTAAVFPVAALPARPVTGVLRSPRAHLVAALTAASAVWLLTAAAHAAPVTATGRPVAGAASSAQPAETPAGRAFRAGLQAQLKGNVGEAQRRFEAAAQLDPGAVPPLLALAGLAQARRDAEATEGYLRQADRAAPSSAAVKLAWGRYHLSRNRIDDAQAAFRQAHLLAPRDAEPLRSLGDLHLLQSGKAAAARTAFQDALAIDGRDAFALYGLGVAQALLGERAEAQRSFAAAAEAAPRDPAPLRASGKLHLEARSPDKALAAFDQGLVRQPKFVPLMLDRVQALVALKRTDDAVAQALAAEKLAPAAADVQLVLADARQAAGRWAEAEAGYLKVIQLAPANPVPYNNLAWMTVERKGDAAKAVSWARKAVELSPGSSPFHDTLGWAERAAGQPTGAAASIGRAIELEPKVASYHFHLGVVQGELKQTAAARASLEKALELDRQSPQADEARRLLKALQAS